MTNPAHEPTLEHDQDDDLPAVTDAEIDAEDTTGDTTDGDGA